MAYIRVRETKARSKGRAVKSYVVCWREPVRDEYGAVVPGKTIQRTDTFDTDKAAKARLLEVENGLAGTRGVDPSSAKVKANTPLGTYARQYLDGLVGSIDPNTIEDYEKVYRAHIGPVFGSRPVASITTAEVTAFRAQLLAPHVRRHGRAKPDTPSKPGLVTRSPKTVKHIVGTLKRILDVAQDDQAIPANPVIANRRRTTKRAANGKAPFKHRPLTANQVAGVVDWIATTRQVTVAVLDAKGKPTGATRTYTRQGNAIYAFAVLFAAHTGVRASELQGLQLKDVTLSAIPGTVGSIRVVRTAMRKNRTWQYGTPKSDASTDRVVPLAAWLADELRDYLTDTHPFSATNTQGFRYAANAPLFPGRVNRFEFDWAKPVHAGSLYEHYFQPACKALGLDKALGGTIRWHDLRHMFATMNLSAGEHYMQVSKWLGHSTFVLTLTTYADYINEDEQVVPKVGRGVVGDNVIKLQRLKA